MSSIAPLCKPESEFSHASFGLLGIGHSHLTALKSALEGRPPPGNHVGITSRFIQLLTPALMPHFHEVHGRIVMNQKLRDTLAEAVAFLPRPAVAAVCLSGNEYHFIGMFNHERRFDFVLSEAPELPLAEGAEVIPEHLLAARFARQIRSSAIVAGFLSAELKHEGISCYALASPAPVPDNSFLINPASRFYKEMTLFGVAPPALRYKLWRLQSRIFVEELSAAGLICLPVPTDTLDPDGFMRQPGWNPDGVHGNRWYGEAQLRQILEIMGAQVAETS